MVQCFWCNIMIILQQLKNILLSHLFEFTQYCHSNIMSTVPLAKHGNTLDGEDLWCNCISATCSFISVIFFAWSHLPINHLISSTHSRAKPSNSFTRYIHTCSSLIPTSLILTSLICLFFKEAQWNYLTSRNPNNLKLHYGSEVTYTLIHPKHLRNYGSCDESM